VNEVDYSFDRRLPEMTGGEVEEGDAEFEVGTVGKLPRVPNHSTTLAAFASVTFEF
jgi:hypothetical protein